MVHAGLRQLLQKVAVPGYGHPDEWLVWRDRLIREHHDAMHSWARQQGHRYVEIVGPDGRHGAFWLVPRAALAG